MNVDKELVVFGFTVTLASAVMAPTSTAQACSPEPYIGSVCITAASYCPEEYYVEANGQLLTLAEHQALFSLLGTNYGGDGRANFAVPDMRGRTPVGVGTGPGLYPVTLGIKRGSDHMTLDVQHMPSHTHPATFTPDGGGSPVSVQASTKTATKPQAAAGYYIASNKALGGEPKFIPGADAGATVALGGVSGGGGGGTVAVGNSGGSQTFVTYPPQQALKYCIAVEGVYPPRP